MAKKKVSQSQQETSLPRQEDLVKAHKEVKPSMDSESSEKLESLKSLNQMLVKEAFERRQQVESLVQSKGCLEMELTRSNSEKVSLNNELTYLAESAAVLELERAVVGDFVSVQLGLRGEAVEQKMRELEIAIDEKEGEIGRLNVKLSVTEGELGNEREVSKRVCLERDEIKDKLDLQIEKGKALRASVIESEARKKAVEQELGDLRAVFNAFETRFDSVTREKESIERGLVESNKLIEEMKENVRVCVKEKERIEDVKAMEIFRRQELEVEVGELNEMVVGFQKEELKLRAVVAELEKECFDGGERRREMEREIDELVKEKRLSEKKIEGLSTEKITIEKDLSEAMIKFEAMVSKNIVVVEAKGRLESEVAELKAVVLELENKIKGLESEVSKFEKVKIEKDEMRVRLDEEKKNVVSLKEMIGALESKIEEKVM
ncbi:hypothetical protein CASFOL_008272 [Castilleja foliolosa]|uniref:Uncharacterized protein n=1 Tax=Castilleja foliolosa TaxID=1961234 RepID=A0ABD3E2M8_9LAMI